MNASQRVLFDGRLWAATVDGHWLGEPPGQVTGFGIDTRTLQRGEVFFALRTEKRDGHDFLAQAKTAGASCAVVSREVREVGLPQLVVADVEGAMKQWARWRREQFTGPVIGVTGSYGKTSTKDLLGLLLGVRTTHTTRANLNNRLGVALTLLALDPERHRRAVIEAGVSVPGEMASLAEMIQPTHVLWTTVGEAHLEGFGTIEAIAEEKARLAAGMSRDGLLVTRGSLAGYQAVRDLSCQKLWVCREKEEAPDVAGDTVHYSVEDVVLGACLTARRLVLPGLSGQRHYGLRLVSGAMVSNAALAVALAERLGIESEQIRRRLSRWRSGSLRGQLLATSKHLLYIDCYNAGPSSMVESYETFRQLAHEELPRLLVLGGMAELGERAAELHEQTGQKMPMREQDRAIVLGAEAEAFAAGLREAGARDDQLEINPARGEATQMIALFEGAVFVKGSRVYRLEDLLPMEASLC